jgi:ankyrin repeat protein
VRFPWSRGAPDRCPFSDVNSRGGSHTTPLHAASVKGHLDVASLLLKMVQILTLVTNGQDSASQGITGRTLVMVESSLEIARLLVNSGANVNVTDDEGWTPLHAAARCGYRDIAELLLESGASLDVRNKNQGHRCTWPVLMGSLTFHASL